MVDLIIDFQEGFNNDQVAIRIDGDTVFRKKDVRTRNQIGFAEKVNLDVSAGRHVVGVSMPAHSAYGELEIDTDATPNLGVSFQNGTLVLTPAAEAFGYL